MYTRAIKNTIGEVALLIPSCSPAGRGEERERAREGGVRYREKREIMNGEH